MWHGGDYRGTVRSGCASRSARARSDAVVPREWVDRFACVSSRPLLRRRLLDEPVVPDDGPAVGHVSRDDRAAAHSGSHADGDVTQHSAASAQHGVVAHGRVALRASHRLARRAEGHLVQDVQVRPEHCGLADDHTGGMVEHHSRSEGGGWVDVDSKGLRCTRLQHECCALRRRRALAPQRVRKAMGGEGLDAFVEESRLQHPVRCRVDEYGLRDVRHEAAQRVGPREDFGHHGRE
mmetsp:Transcript_37148/g.63799  ORF Transcript_37148/g.63799 Transcript_37148/m.63799 type:complete len:236 (-) Transcript_37148:1562-2269(-)